MPQGRRKVPFSAKQKKIQLQQKRERKSEARPKHTSDGKSLSNLQSVEACSSSTLKMPDVEIINKQPVSNIKRDPNRYQLVFKRETDEEIKQRLALAKQPFKILSEECIEVSYEEVFYPGSQIEMPKRPILNYQSLTKEAFEAKEQKYFREYLDDLERKFSGDQLSHFEMNLETWRQLWRVIEFSDIVLLVVDVRYAVYHFSPSLYHYVTKEKKKDMILVLNKVDLVPASLVLAWKEYLKKSFPQLEVLCFASYAGMIIKEGKRGKRIGNLHMAVEGAQRLLELCEEIVKQEVDLSSWRDKIKAEAADFELDGQHKKSTIQIMREVPNDVSPCSEQRYRDNILTIGFVGHPNVGKSSFLNAIRGKKVVSVSRTPGHTKHYQTIMLTHNVRLCDCPGLVFPSLVSKPLQVLMGCYPIAQLREPYSVVGFLSQRVPVQNILKLQHPIDELGEEGDWSAYAICEAWAEKRGFKTAKASRPDVYRAANHILRMALDGRTICLAFYPPNYTEEKAMWIQHPGLSEIVAIQHHRSSTSAHLENLTESDQSNDDQSVEDEESDDCHPEANKTSRNKFRLLSNEA